MGQGELIDRLPPSVQALNRSFSNQSVLTARGRRRMTRTVFLAFWAQRVWCKKLGGSACYVADYVCAKRNAVFLHVDYANAEKILKELLKDRNNG